jgi:hypothetical protein
MKIIKTKDPNSIKFLVDKVQELIDKENITEYNKSLFLKWLRQNISFPILGLWVAIEEFENEGEKSFEILGFAIATIQANLKEEYISISQLFGDEEVEFALLEKIYNWGKENGINKFMTNSKNPERWQGYGFEIDYHILIKDINKVQEIVENTIDDIVEVEKDSASETEKEE